jgi:hypothetical protein
MKCVFRLSVLGRTFPIYLAAVLAGPSVWTAENPIPLQATGRMPVKEVTVFKDGHAFVVQEGAMETDGAGNVVLDYLPSPVIGTFWPYVTEPKAKLAGVVASQRRVTVSRTALNLRELLEANLGREAIITESSTNRYEATIMNVPTRSAAELEATSPPNQGERLPEKGNLILLRTAEGVKAVALDRIQDVTFKNGFQPASANEEFRNLLTLKLDWKPGRPGKTARVGLIYVQKGVRWIPSYKVTVDGQGHAAVKMQATLLNELTDLEDADVNLVIGVPTFAFKETIDPMALDQTAAQLSHFFQSGSGGRAGLLAANFSNALMTQTTRMGETRSGAVSGAEGPESPEGTRSEDLYVFHVGHVTLKKGERMVVTVVEFTLPYQDVFTLELPFAPPPEVRGNMNTSQQQELAHLFSAPKVMHKLRLNNQSRYPLTTAPALILQRDRVLAQGLMTYTAAGSSSDLPVTTAVDIQVKKSDTETSRTPNAVKHNGDAFTRVDLNGKITLTNHRDQPVEIEVTRYVLGNAGRADHEGTVEKINVFENGDYLGSVEYPYWWGWYGWPSWWNYFNGIGRIIWRVKLDPGQEVKLGYDWNYLWR